MKLSNLTLTQQTKPGLALYDLTQSINEKIKQVGIEQGIAVITSQHTTTALTINENEERLLEDIDTFFDKLVPADERYLHNDIHLRDCPPDEPENAHAHIIAMLLGSSESVPIVDGRLQLGQWQSVMLTELDGPRERKVALQLMGQ